MRAGEKARSAGQSTVAISQPPQCQS
jgi:hypothetical protein